HSEPGSNPSQMSRSPPTTAPVECRGEERGHRSSPQRVEENAGRTPSPAVPIRPQEPDGPTRAVCRSNAPSHRQGTGRPSRPGRIRINHAHAGFPQGFMTRRILLSLTKERKGGRCLPLTLRLVVFG